MFKEKFNKRFIELEDQYSSISWKSTEYSGRDADSVLWNKWATSAQNLIKAVFHEHSPHYVNFVQALSDCVGYESELKKLFGIFLSAKEDFIGGYVFDVDLRVSGEVFGDFVVMAKHALNEGNKDVAAVLASAALEDTLKKFALLNGLSVQDQNMTEVVKALKSKGFVSGAQKTLLDTMPKMRNYAMHAQWEKLSEPDVSSIIGFVEQFLLSNYG